MQHHHVELLFLLVLQPTAVCFEISDVLFSINVRLKINFPFTFIVASDRPKPHAAPIASSRPNLHDAPVAVMVMCLRILRTHIFMLGVTSSFCSLVEVLRGSPCRHSCHSIFSRSLMCNELAFVSRVQMQRKTLQHVCSCWKLKDSQPQKRLTNCFE